MFFKKKKKVVKTRFDRIFLIVLDSVGIGEADDAEKFDSVGANTLKHTLECSMHNLKNLKNLGLYNLLDDADKDTETISYYCKAAEISNGKDTLTGHLEMMGVETKKPFNTYECFPDELINQLVSKSGRNVIGNCIASGTEIIQQLGDEHVKTGDIIVYTSADSVLQIAAHESVVPLNELYEICEMAREITKDEKYKIGRIIARPFTGSSGNYIRTGNRHDYALNPEDKTTLDELRRYGYEVISIGKIADIFNNCGITMSGPTRDNTDGIRKLLDITKKDFKGLCFTNLNDFDSKYGHRRDASGYADALKGFDEFIPHIIANLTERDLMIITADHGNDPTYKGTDHTREFVPVLIYSKQLKKTGRLENLTTFASIGYTIADNFKVPTPKIGQSFLDKLK